MMNKLLGMEVSMNIMHSCLANDELEQLAQAFAHWRQGRPTPRERIPAHLWHQAVALTESLPLSRVAKRLGLCGADLKKHGGMPKAQSHDMSLDTPVHFVDVSATLLGSLSSAEIDLQRADGSRMRLVCREPQPPLVALVSAFLEAQ
jgi:hypothetical protein